MLGKSYNEIRFKHEIRPHPNSSPLYVVKYLVQQPEDLQLKLPKHYYGDRQLLDNLKRRNGSIRHGVFYTSLQLNYINSRF